MKSKRTLKNLSIMASVVFLSFIMMTDGVCWGLQSIRQRDDIAVDDHITGGLLFDGPEGRDQFGRALASGDFNGDGIADLAIGVPYEDLETTNTSNGEGDFESVGPTLTPSNHGVVHIVYGTEDDEYLNSWENPVDFAGLTTTLKAPQTFHQDVDGVEDSAEDQDIFGYSLAVGDFNSDGADDLAVGVPGEDIKIDGRTVRDAGAVHVFYGSPRRVLPRPWGKPIVIIGGLSSENNQLWYQGKEHTFGPTGWEIAVKIDGEPNRDDQFGRSLTTGDFDGDGYDDLAVGVPYDDIDGKKDVGSVNVIYGGASGLNFSGNQLWNQDNPEMMDMAQENDRFGYALAAGNFDGDVDGTDDLAIGVPYEDIDAKIDVGAINVIYGVHNSGLSADKCHFLYQGHALLRGWPGNGESFGFSLAAGNFDGDDCDDLAVGVPFQNIDDKEDVGAVHVLYGGDFYGLASRKDRIWHRNNLGDACRSTGISACSVRDDERFGFSLAAGNFDGEGHDDLAVGVPNYSGGGRYTNWSGGEDAIEALHGSCSRLDVGFRNKAGKVMVVYTTPTGFSGFVSIHQGSPWAMYPSGSYDEYLMRDLWNEENDRFGYSLAAGNFDGDGFDDLAIGAPFEHLSYQKVEACTEVERCPQDRPCFMERVCGWHYKQTDDAGMVNVAYGSEL